MLKYTKKELALLHNRALNALIDVAGDINHLAKMLDLPHQTVVGWVRRGRISKKGAQLVAAHPRLGKEFTADELRPDI